MEKKTIHGRGAQKDTGNKFLKHSYEPYFEDLKDIEEQETLLFDNPKTTYIEVHPKTFVNKITSSDLTSMQNSANPYQGCEHGCVYCYARNSHEYWGYNAALDFESKILIKHNAPQLLEKKLKSKSWKGELIVFSGNTDCYQPIERKLQLTRQCLETMLKYKNPVGIITKNTLIERDLDILVELNKLNLLRVNFSLTTLNEDIKRVLEPRTASVKNALRTIKTLSDNDIHVNVMMSPIIPGLTDSEILPLIKTVAEHGAVSAVYQIVRLNGALGDIFTDWLQKTLPLKADKLLAKIKEARGGKLNENQFGKRMQGEGVIAEIIDKQFKLACKKYFKSYTKILLDYSLYHKNKESQLKLF